MSTISLDEALSQLQAMFPGVAQDVIMAVLESNGGQMQHTVSQLLELDPGMEGAAAGGAGATSAGAEGATSTSSPNHGDDTESFKEETPGAVVRPPPSSIAAPTAAPSGPAVASGGRRRWRNPLPDDFLQVPGRNRVPATSTPAQVVEQDALLAQMMHNELFLTELRNHPDFAEYLEAEEEFFHHQLAASMARGASLEARRRPAHASASSSSHRRRGHAAQESQGPTLSQKVAAMGGEMRRKFNAFAVRFAAKFNRNGEEAKDNTENRGLLGAAAAPDDSDDDDDVMGSGVTSRGDELAPARDAASTKKRA